MILACRSLFNTKGKNIVRHVSKISQLLPLASKQQNETSCFWDFM